MDIWYWMLEYMKVFLGYSFLMFLWPSVVFYGYLRKKSKTYRFSFCVTVMIVFINTIVLTFGLLDILSQRLIYTVFYAIFFVALIRNAIAYLDMKYRRMMEEKFPDVRSLYGRYRIVIIILSFFIVLFSYIKKAVHCLSFDYIKKVRSCNKPKIRLKIKKYIWSLGNKINSSFWKYGITAIVLVWGMIYFSYGAFQVHSYGAGDLYTHHEWIYGLIRGDIFSGGVYPEAMHCFIYCMNTLFGIRVYSILLFLQGIHVVVFLLSVYFLLKKIFYWQYTPVFVLALFLTLDLSNADLIRSMYRLQITLPQEFGLHTVCVCALYLIKYLYDDHTAAKNNKKFKWDENILLFLMALAASISTHFHVVIMVFIICFSFAIFAWKKVMSRKYFVPLIVSVFSACFIAVIPMTGALMQGIPFNDSIKWAVNVMNGEESRELRQQDENAEHEEEVESGREIQDINRNGINFITPICDILSRIYENGFVALYGKGRGLCFFFIIIMAALLCGVFKWKTHAHYVSRICFGYLSLILASVFYILVYAAPMIGLPDIMPEGRFFAIGHMMLLAAIVIPIDMAFYGLAGICSHFSLRVLSFVSMIGIYLGAIATGNFRGYLFYEVSRYNSVVDVTNRIIDTFPQYSYTIVSPSDEIYPIIQDGWHEEILTFVEKSSGEEYTLPSEYVFIFIEKKPLLYAQSHFFQGPSWLGKEKYLVPYWEKYSLRYPNSGASQGSVIETSDISLEDAKKDIPDYDNAWLMYSKLENRTVLESKAYEWCQRFAKLHPSVLNIYYEDDEFICYYFRQDLANPLYELGIG